MLSEISGDVHAERDLGRSRYQRSVVRTIIMFTASSAVQFYLLHHCSVTVIIRCYCCTGMWLSTTVDRVPQVMQSPSHYFLPATLALAIFDGVVSNFGNKDIIPVFFL